MQLTFVTDLGQSYTVDIDPDMELENVMALLEAEVGRVNSPLPSAYNLHISLLFSLPAPHFSPRITLCGVGCSQAYPLANKASRTMDAN
jgi:hypothetical protein